MRRFRNSLGWLMMGSAGLLATANVDAQVTKVENGYLFRIKYTKGNITHYQLTTTTTLPPGMAGPNSDKPMIMNMVAPITMTVVSVTGNKATIKSDVGPMMMNGSALSKVQTQQITVDDRANLRATLPAQEPAWDWSK